MSAKVSIIVPIYNVEKYLDRCMQTLLGQTLKDIEIIMVDDGSPDRCPQMCDEYAKKDSRVKVVHKQNGGLGYARNSGLDIATGEYVAFVDSDDFVDVAMYEKLYVTAVTESADIVYCNHNLFVSSTGRVEKPYAPFVQDTTFRGDDVVNEVLKNMIASAPDAPTERKYYMSVWRGIFRWSVVGDIRFVSERDYLSEDIFFQAMVLQRTAVVTFVADCLYFYRENDVSLTHAYRKDRIEKSIALYEHLCKVLKDVIARNSVEWNVRLMKLLYGYFRFSMFSNINAAANMQDLRRDFRKCAEYLKKISFYEKYPVAVIPTKHKLLLSLLKYNMFLPFYLLAKMTK